MAREDEVRTAEPSFGLIRIGHRRHGGAGASLFGSDIPHPDTVVITLAQGEHIRDLSNDWYHDIGHVAEVEMSQAQFAQFITTPNVGTGIPCTIRYVRDVGEVQHKAEPPKRQLFEAELKATCRKATETVRAIEAELDTLLQGVPKAKAKAIKDAVSRAGSALSSSVPFVFHQFMEQMDNVVTEAKADYEAFVMRGITDAGLMALREQYLQQMQEATPDALEIPTTAPCAYCGKPLPYAPGWNPPCPDCAGAQVEVPAEK